MKTKTPFSVSMIALTILSISIFSCKDKCKDVAGTGGSFTIVAFPQHHSAPIISESLPGYPDSAFVKFSPPGDFVTTSNPADYDLVLVGDSGENHVHIENLKCGDYYIFMTGWDVNGNWRVKGGIPVNIPVDAPSEIDQDVPVTE
ncbi:MAG TPA: hypothetical protein VE978_15155 [Chitinophagales bacterium]|nr:hypothetical protein [Chitinophagales bacterium]